LVFFHAFFVSAGLKVYVDLPSYKLFQWPLREIFFWKLGNVLSSNVEKVKIAEKG
jgi:hypothetical protein